DMTGERTTTSSPTPTRKPPGARPQANARATQPSSISHSQINRHLPTPPKPVILSNSASSASPHHSEALSIEKPFDLDRVCYPSKEGRMFSWLRREDRDTEYQLRLGANGMYTAYMNGQLGGSEFGAWVINPQSITKLEFSFENRLVKLTRTWNGDPKAYIFFGFSDGAEGFVQRILDAAKPETKIAKLEP
ncbi:hypothetical protein N431DRAFT_342655, partial [Stipitochalara longipes BDJ]